MITLLQPMNIRQKSFYGKAKVRTEGNTLTLISYTTEIATYNQDTKEFKMLCDYDKHLSNTTMRHLSEFRLQLGLDKLRKKDVFDKYYK